MKINFFLADLTIQREIVVVDPQRMWSLYTDKLGYLMPQTCYK